MYPRRSGGGNGSFDYGNNSEQIGLLSFLNGFFYHVLIIVFDFILFLLASHGCSKFLILYHTLPQLFSSWNEG